MLCLGVLFNSCSVLFRYYNSRLDLADKLGPEGALSTHLTHLATAVAQLLYTMSTGKEDTNITADESTVRIVVLEKSMYICHYIRYKQNPSTKRDMLTFPTYSPS